MSYQMLKLKRLKRKKDIPDSVLLHVVAHVNLNGDRFKVLVDRHKLFLTSSELFLYNMVNGKWYQLVNDKGEG
jgi:hypothetical protein